MFTHTIPGPPPGAGAPESSVARDACALVDVELIGAGVLAATGEVDGAGVSARWNQVRLAGVVAAAGDAVTPGDAVGAEPVAVVFSFLTRLRLAGLGETSGAVLAEAGVGVTVAVAVEASFLECLCFLAGLAEVSGLALGAGVWATRVATKNPTSAIVRLRGLFMIAENTDTAVTLAIIK